MFIKLRNSTYQHLGLILFCLLSVVVSAGLTTYVANAQTTSEIEAKIKQLESKLENTKSQKDSLSREIDVIEGSIEIKESQIYRSTLQIAEKEKELEVLQEDIRLLEVRLGRLDGNIDEQENVINLIVRKQYIDSQKPFLYKILSYKNFGKFIAETEYLRLAKIEDEILLTKMRQTKENYEDQQELINLKKEQVIKVKSDIEYNKQEQITLKASLETQKQSKDDLLSITKNDEKRYQQLLAQAKKELEQAQAALNVVIKTGKSQKVKKGEVIGTMGNTGWSTGPHLHFGVYKLSRSDFDGAGMWGWYNSNSRNPFDYLEQKTLGNNKYGKGNMAWPMKSPIVLTQTYHINYNPRHPAIDIVGLGDKTIYSVDDGEAYFCRSCLNDGGNWAFIFHDDNIMTVYGHLK